MTVETAAGPRVLLIALQRLGDVLLTTPLLHTLRRAWREAQIDVLVHTGTEGVLEGNPDLSGILTLAPAAPATARLALLRRLWRRYDLSLTTQAGDTPHLLAWAAAPRRVGLVATLGGGDAWKRRSCKPWVLLDDVHTHTVVQNLALAAALGLDGPSSPVVAPRAPPADLAGLRLPTGPYAVLHPYPMYRYKRWPHEHWRALARALVARGLAVVLSGGTDAQERAACADIARSCAGCLDLSGQLRLAQWSHVLGPARLYVGPDTVTTHLAAACGTPTVALFGPSNPVKWGPWPATGAAAPSPYVMRGRQQRVGNVVLLQGPGDCVPCRLEGCEQHRDSPSRCLDELALADVLDATDQLLATPSPVPCTC